MRICEQRYQSSITSQHQQYTSHNVLLALIHLTNNAAKLIMTSTDIKLDVEIVHHLIEMKRRWLPLWLGVHLRDANALACAHVNDDLITTAAE